MFEKMTEGPYYAGSYEVWGVAEMNDGSKEYVLIASTNPPGVDVAPYEEARANAAAISALPEMVALVQEVAADGDMRGAPAGSKDRELVGMADAIVEKVQRAYGGADPIPQGGLFDEHA